MNPKNEAEQPVDDADEKGAERALTDSELNMVVAAVKSQLAARTERDHDTDKTRGAADLRAAMSEKMAEAWQRKIPIHIEGIHMPKADFARFVRDGYEKELFGLLPSAMFEREFPTGSYFLACIVEQHPEVQQGGKVIEKAQFLLLVRRPTGFMHLEVMTENQLKSAKREPRL